MEPFVGTFAKDDNVHRMRLAVFADAGVPWGTAAASGGMGTGWTAELEVHRAGVAAVLVTLSGSWETADEFACLFTIGTVSALYPTSPEVSTDFEAFLKLTKLTSVFITGPDGDARTPFRFTVRDVSP